VDEVRAIAENFSYVSSATSYWPRIRIAEMVIGLSGRSRIRRPKCSIYRLEVPALVGDERLSGKRNTARLRFYDSFEDCQFADHRFGRRRSERPPRGVHPASTPNSLMASS